MRAADLAFPRNGARVRAPDMPTEPEIATLSQVVHRAAHAVDPTATDDGVWDLYRRFEDRDEPITAVQTLSETLAEGAGAIDPQAEDPAVQMTIAVATYLAFRRDEIDDDPEELMRLAARAEFDGSPPPALANWLEERGVDV